MVTGEAGWFQEGRSLMHIFKVVLSIAIGMGAVLPVHGAPPLMQRVADAAMLRWPGGNLGASGYPEVWGYQKGTFLEGIEAAASVTHDPRYSDYLKTAVDHAVNPNGTIRTFPNEVHSLDQILMGRQLLLLFHSTGEARYATAAKEVYDELLRQPRTKSGGFWHKQIYPSQMWLDGAYMAEPFYAEYAATFDKSADFDDIALQFSLLEKYTRDPRTGLLYHGWDESRKQAWADHVTGRSPAVWSRAVGWYAMALVDSLQYFPAQTPKRQVLLDILSRLAPVLEKYQDTKTGVWFEVMDKNGAPGNFLEESASCMFVYSLLKAVRLGYLPTRYRKVALRGWRGVQQNFIEIAPDGAVHVTQIVKGAGLGGTPYRDGTYGYYTGVKVVSDEPKGVGAFLLAASEAARAGASAQQLKLSAAESSH